VYLYTLYLVVIKIGHEFKDKSLLYTVPIYTIRIAIQTRCCLFFYIMFYIYAFKNVKCLYRNVSEY